MTRRGSYAKGVAKREEILERALGVVGRQGYRRASVKEIAEAVGLSQAGLLHYFDSKEELFTEILRKRDERDRADVTAPAGDAQAGFLAVIGHNADVPGLVELFSRMSVEAADPAHPAHAFFLARGQRLRSELVETLESLPHAPSVDPETLARIVQAAADGLQLQWLLDDTVDMAGTMRALFDALDARPH